MYRKTEDFLIDWKHESESTLKIFKNISTEMLNKKDNKNVRSIAVLTWHITTTIPEMMTKAGLTIIGVDEHSTAPDTIEKIIDGYKTAANSLTVELLKNWKDENLTEETQMYGQLWKRGATLSILIKHQAHHRGQLTVLMRYAGLIVPGVYGPAKEEWTKMNMSAME